MTTVESCGPLKRTNGYGDCWLGLMTKAAIGAYMLRHAPDEEEYLRHRFKLSKLASYLDQLKGSWVEITYLGDDRQIGGTLKSVNPDNITCSVKPPKSNLQIVTYGIVDDSPEDHPPKVTPVIDLSSLQPFKR